jgi:hypothetical protein
MPLGFAFAGQPRRLSPHEPRVKILTLSHKTRQGWGTLVHFSEVFAEFGEAAYYQELLALGGGVYFFVF